MIPSVASAVLTTSVNAVKIGRDYTIVTDLKSAVIVWEKHRERMMAEGMGSRDMPSVNACIDKRLYRISWNGRVWHPTTGAEILY